MCKKGLVDICSIVLETTIQPSSLCVNASEVGSIHAQTPCRVGTAAHLFRFGYATASLRMIGIVAALSLHDKASQAHCIHLYLRRRHPIPMPPCSWHLPIEIPCPMSFTHSSVFALFFRLCIIHADMLSMDFDMLLFCP